MLTDPDLLTIESAVESSLPKIQDKLDAYAADNAALSSKVATQGALLGQPILSTYQNFEGLESLPGWILGKGAGTGAAPGKDAPGTWHVSGDGTADVTISPTAPYQNSYWYRNFPTPAPKAVTRFSHRVAYYAPDLATLNASQAWENECKGWNGVWCADMAWAPIFKGDPAKGVKPGYWHYFNYGHGPGTPGWIPSQIPIRYVAGNWMVMQAEFLVDWVNSNKTHLAVTIDGIRYEVGWSQKCVADTHAPRFLTSVQLDADGKGTPYTVKVQNSLSWV